MESISIPRISHAIPGPETVTRTILDNGVTVLIRENRSAPVVILEGLITAGAIHDPADRLGLASFVASMVTRGSDRYDFDHFNEITEAVGASLNVSADSHATHFGLSCLAEDFADLIDVLADALQRPSFPADQAEIVLGQTLVYHQERLHDTQQIAGLRFFETLYDGHPYSHAVSGYPETARAISRDDLVAFHAERYTPQEAIIVVSGDVAPDAALALLTDAFGQWQGGAPEKSLPDVEPIEESRRVDIAMPHKFQSDIVVGCLAVPRSHPDFYALRVANTILGSFGMMGRLGESVREQQGLAYSCSSSLDVDLIAGAWFASAGVSPENVEQAVAAILHEFERLGSKPVPAEELRDSQDYMTGIVPLALETNAGVASTLLNMEWYGLGLGYLQRYNELIYAVMPEDVQRVAQQYLRPDKSVLVVAGPRVA